MRAILFKDKILKKIKKSEVNPVHNSVLTILDKVHKILKLGQKYKQFFKIRKNLSAIILTQFLL